MGTSSARRGPTTALWRLAKGAATRYMSPEGGGELHAREIVVRYLAALEETPGQGDRLAVFRFTRKIAQDLGAFWKEGHIRGWEEVLKDRDLEPLNHGDAAVLAQGISAVLVGSGGGLEEAVVRTTLSLILRQALQFGHKVTSAHLVRQFLTTVLYMRLALDLGEPLEAAAGSSQRYREGLKDIREFIEVSSPTDGQQEPPASPKHWQGLPGWAWVTATMTALMDKLMK